MSHIVTGAFGFSGRFIAKKLLDQGHDVTTLTNSPDRENLFGGRIKARPFSFENHDTMVEGMGGSTVLYNTYWVRFNHGRLTLERAQKNTLALFLAAKAAGVQRVVHISITNPSPDSPFEYFRRKAEVETALAESRMSYSILRPAAIFGPGGILINNIAWALRKMPVYSIFGDGRYRFRPIFVEDLADLAVREAVGTDNRVVDAVGPENFEYIELVRAIGECIGKRPILLKVPPVLGYMGVSLFGLLMRDKVMTRDELGSLMGGLLSTDSPATGGTKLTDWVRQNADTLGSHYISELGRMRAR